MVQEIIASQDDGKASFKEELARKDKQIAVRDKELARKDELNERIELEKIVAEASLESVTKTLGHTNELKRAADQECKICFLDTNGEKYALIPCLRLNTARESISAALK